MKTLVDINWRNLPALINYMLIGMILLFSSCAGDDEDNIPTGNYEYTIAGGFSKTITGTEAEFFTDNGIFYIRLDKETDHLSAQIYAEPITEKSYVVKSETNAEVTTGSVFTDDFHSFNTKFGTGGSVSITSVETNVVKGTFTMNMNDNSFSDQIVVNVSGSFTAIKRSF
jgi:hypothetical protein